MSYFSDREQGPKPRIEEAIDQNTWGGIIATIRSRINDGSFGCRFPESCMDGGVPCGCDEYSFTQALKAEIPDIPWPLDEAQFPPTLAILDLIEFCYKSVGKPVSIEYHSFAKHNHLRFEREEGQAAFCKDINMIFARNGLAYELDPDGLIRRLPPKVLGEALKLAKFQTGDAELDSLLETARGKYLDPDLTVRREALEKLWDAWERLKTTEPGKDKKESASALLDKCAPEVNFRKTLENEAVELTRIGNTFRIRHSETSQVPLESSEHVDYLFHRLFALINMILQCRK